MYFIVALLDSYVNSTYIGYFIPYCASYFMVGFSVIVRCGGVAGLSGLAMFSPSLQRRIFFVGRGWL